MPEIKKKMGNAEKRKCRKNKKAMPKKQQHEHNVIYIYICVYIYMYIRIYQKIITNIQATTLAK